MSKPAKRTNAGTRHEVAVLSRCWPQKAMLPADACVLRQCAEELLQGTLLLVSFSVFVVALAEVGGDVREVFNDVGRTCVFCDVFRDDSHNFLFSHFDVFQVLLNLPQNHSKYIHANHNRTKRRTPDAAVGPNSLVKNYLDTCNAAFHQTEWTFCGKEVQFLNFCRNKPRFPQDKQNHTSRKFGVLHHCNPLQHEAVRLSATTKSVPPGEPTWQGSDVFILSDQFLGLFGQMMANVEGCQCFGVVI